MLCCACCVHLEMHAEHSAQFVDVAARENVTRIGYGAQGLARQAHEVLIRALQLGGLAGVLVGVSQVLWSYAGSGGGAAGLFTKDPVVIAASNAVLLLVYLAMVRTSSPHGAAEHPCAYVAAFPQICADVIVPRLHTNEPQQHDFVRAGMYGILLTASLVLQQPIIPSAHTIMEGRLLGGMETTFVARRTSLSAAVSCVGLLAARQAGGQLPLVWSALLMYNLCAFVCDIWCVQQRRLAEMEIGRAACSVDYGDGFEPHVELKLA